jgi:cytoskeletal protein CcmA (bactofilin family)
MTDVSDGNGLSKPTTPRPLPTAPARPMAVTPAAATPAAGSGSTSSAMPLPPKPAEPSARRTEGLAPIIPTPRRDAETRRLIVGREISLTGEITSCERLVVEGSVEANLNNCREIEIAEMGLMKGTATIEEAEIRGRYEGSLTVRKRLYIRATGKVTGTVRYGQLEIECGGQVSGDVQAHPSGEDEVRPVRVVGMAGDLKI